MRRSVERRAAAGGTVVGEDEAGGRRVGEGAGTAAVSQFGDGGCLGDEQGGDQGGRRGGGWRRSSRRRAWWRVAAGVAGSRRRRDLEKIWVGRGRRAREGESDALARVSQHPPVYILSQLSTAGCFEQTAGAFLQKWCARISNTCLRPVIGSGRHSVRRRAFSSPAP
jgi:hypothetical protein